MNEPYEQTITAGLIGSCTERFSPGYEVVSVSLSLSAEAEGEVLSIERGFGPEADDEGVCLVLSPSQQCVYEPFEQLTLTRRSLGMKFTKEAEVVFKVTSVLISFQASDTDFDGFKARLRAICGDASYFGFEP